MSFYVIEGIDGSGKTSLVNALKQLVKEQGLEEKFVFNKEPDGVGSDFSLAVRKTIIDYPELHNLPATLLFLAARFNNIFERIMPALLNGKIVISDRWNESTVIYQNNYFHQFEIQDFFNLIGQKFFYSDKNLDNLLNHEETLLNELARRYTCFIVDVPVSVAVDRIKKYRKLDKFEEAKLIDMERMRQDYIKLVSDYQKDVLHYGIHYPLLDGQLPTEELARQVLAYILEHESVK